MTGGATSDLTSNKSHLANKLNFSGQLGKDMRGLFARDEIETTPAGARELLKCQPENVGESSMVGDKAVGII